MSYQHAVFTKMLDIRSTLKIIDSMSVLHNAHAHKCVFFLRYYAAAKHRIDMWLSLDRLARSANGLIFSQELLLSRSAISRSNFHILFQWDISFEVLSAL